MQLIICCILGTYLYIETNTGGTNQKARLNSRIFPSSDGQFNCLYFWYHMYGQSKLLNINARFSSSLLLNCRDIFKSFISKSEKLKSYITLVSDCIA